MAPPHRLENALARAEELIVVGQKAAALQTLHDAIMSKWLQHNVQALEAIMMKFVELCVDLRRGRTLKDGLHQYRGACLNVNLMGLEGVVKRLVELTEARLEAAQAEVSDSVAVTDSLDNAWCSSARGERTGEKDETVSPWFRFLWEVYRVVLDICRHNTKLEPIYELVAQSAFNFCRRNSRQGEFRRLCEILRHHLSIIVKYPGQVNGIVLTEAESHRIQLGLRFEQLSLATDLELWQEAFRTIEDIHGLFTLARKAVPHATLMVYYEKIARIFMMSDNYLFLAATWNKLYVIAQAQGLGEEKVKEAATNFVLASLAIPLLAPLNITSSVGREEREAQNQRLATFLGLATIPSASTLLDEIRGRGVLEHVPQLKGLFASMSKVTIDKDAFKALATEATTLGTFAIPIHQNLVALLFKHLSAQSNRVSIPELEQLLSMDDLEAFVLKGTKTGDFAARIDHRAAEIVFERPCFQREATDLSEELLTSQMSQLVKNIQRATQLLEKPQLSAILSSSLAVLGSEHQSNLSRKTAIEKKKEQLERLLRQREEDEAKERSKKQAAEQEAKKAKELEEARERERVKLQQEREQIRKEQAKLREAELEAAKAKLQKAADAEKLVAAFKRLDFMERAHRQEELPLLNQDYERQKVADRQAYDERVRLINERASAKHSADLEVKKHLGQMTGEYEAYLAKVKETRLAALETKRAAMAAELEAEKEARRQETLTQLRRKHEQALEMERLRKEQAARMEAERAAYEAKIREQQQQQQQQAASASAYRPPAARSAFGSSTAPAPAASSSAFGSSRPSAFGSRAPPTATSAFGRSTTTEAPATSPAPTSGNAAFGSAWRRPGDAGPSSAAGPRDSKSAFTRRT